MRKSLANTNVRLSGFTADASQEARIGQLIEPQPDGCWLFKGNVDQYGRAYAGASRRLTVHRFVYETLIGPIPQGRLLHHLCHTPGCCNPQHLEVVSPSQHRAIHDLERSPEPQGKDPVALWRHAQKLARATTDR